MRQDNTRLQERTEQLARETKVTDTSGAEGEDIHT